MLANEAGMLRCFRLVELLRISLDLIHFYRQVRTLSASCWQAWRGAKDSEQRIADFLLLASIFIFYHGRSGEVKLKFSSLRQFGLGAEEFGNLRIKQGPSDSRRACRGRAKNFV